MAHGYDTLVNHLKTTFNLVQHHKWSYSDLQEMVPWEKSLYVDMLAQYLEDEKLKDRQLKNNK